jgi:signal transduction histidine kinase
MSELSETHDLDLRTAIQREEFEKFITDLTHDIRNRLNGIALEAADLAEQAGADGTRLQQYVQECSAYLKSVRETLAPDDSRTSHITLSDFIRKSREKKVR